MNKNLIGLSTVLIIIFTSDAHSDYLVYPQGKDFNSSINLPEPGCESNVSDLEDGHYILCAKDDGIEYPVISGNAFQLSKVEARFAFNCSGTDYSGYGNHFESTDLSVLTGKNIYTPYRSIRSAGHTSYSLSMGNASYNAPDGTLYYQKIRSFTKSQDWGGRNISVPTRGDYYVWTGPSQYRTNVSSIYSPYNYTTQKPAYRACRLKL